MQINLEEVFVSDFPGVNSSKNSGLLCVETTADGDALLSSALSARSFRGVHLNPVFAGPAFSDLSLEELWRTFEDNCNGGLPFRLNDTVSDYMFSKVILDEDEFNMVVSIQRLTYSMALRAGFEENLSLLERLFIGGGHLNYKQNASDPPAAIARNCNIVWFSSKPGTDGIAAISEVMYEDILEHELFVSDDSLASHTIGSQIGSGAIFSLPVRRSGFAIIVRIELPGGGFRLAKIPSGNRLLSFRDVQNRRVFVRILYEFGRLSGTRGHMIASLSNVGAPETVQSNNDTIPPIQPHYLTQHRSFPSHTTSITSSLKLNCGDDICVSSVQPSKSDFDELRKLLELERIRIEQQ